MKNEINILTSLGLKRARSRRYRRFEWFGPGYAYAFIELHSDGTTTCHWTNRLAELIIKAYERAYYEAIQK